MTTTHIIHHEGREYDLYTLETPFGRLPEPVKAALRAWPHGLEHFGGHGWEAWTKWGFVWAFAYRAKPAPKITEYVLRLGNGRDSNITHLITVRYPGDALPFGTYTGPDGAEFVVEDATGGTNDE